MLVNAVDLQFRYGTDGAPRVIDGLSLQVDTGAIIGILGPNGSGKTTLIKLLSGAMAPDAGTVALDGVPLSRLPRARLARRVAVVPQETHLAFDYTALEIVLMGRYPRLGAFEIEGPDDIRCAMEALSATGMRDLSSRQFPTLSGGEKQRVIIASALAQLDERFSPEARDESCGGSILFMDEPTASLDLRYQLELTALLRHLHADRGIALILSTHDLRLASALCTRLVLLAGGRILADGSPRDVLTPDLVGELYGVDAALVAQVLG